MWYGFVVPKCNCDDRGVQENSQSGDWCWLKESPCIKMDGNRVDGNVKWLRCEYKGEIQVHCRGIG